MVHIIRVIFTFVFAIFSFTVLAADFFAVQDGPWTQGATWGNAGNVAGVDYPGANDDAYTNGFKISVLPIPTAQCRDLYVDNATPGSISLQLPVVSVLTINGTLYSYWTSFGFIYPPSVAGLISGPGTLRFTGTNFGNAQGVLQTEDELIFFWGSIASLGRIEFNLGTGTGTISQLYDPGFTTDRLSCSQFVLNSGTLTMDEFTTAGIAASSQLTVSSGATLNLPGAATQNGLVTSRIPTATVGGTLNLTTSNSFINAVTFNLSSAGNLNINFDDPTMQTEGWWHTTNSPNTATLDATSTVTYGSTFDQNVYARTYGNLVLNGGGNKTVPNNGALNISGSLTINSPSVNFVTLNAIGITISGSLLNQGTWSPVQLITFDSPSIATIGGSQSITFGGGVTVNKPGGRLTMATATSINTNISNGITISAGTLSLGNVNTTLTGGNIANDAAGVLTSGSSGTLRIQGTSQLSGDGSYTLTNLEVLGSGDCTINSDIAFTGNIINNGLLSFSSAADVTFNGSGIQSISGNPFSINDMVIDKDGSSVLSNNGTLTLLGTLTMTTGTFDADGASGTGSFILNSNASGDARIGPMAGGSIDGNVTFRRYFNSNVTNRYRNFSFQILGVTRGQLQSFFTMVPGSFAWYDENVPGDYDQGWRIQNSGPLVAGRAYTIGMYDTGPITVSLTGPLFLNTSTNDGAYDYHIQYTDDPSQPPSEDGWNFVANPYASPIDWDAASGWTKLGGIDAAAAVWSAEDNAYRYSNINWNGIVAQGQSFWVHTTSAATLRSAEAVKVSTTDPFFYRKENVIPDDRLMVRLESDSSYDVAVVRYLAKATVEYDGAFDAYKLPNKIFNLSSLTPGGENLAVNALPRSFCTTHIKLNITNIVPGSYRFSFESVDSFHDLDSLVLYDRFLEKSVRITEGAEYGFSVTTDPASYGSGRFELGFNYPETGLFDPEISLDNRKLVSNFESGNQWLLNGEIIPDETDNYLLPTVSGEYQVMVSDGICSTKSSVFKLDRIPSRIHPNPATTHFIIDLTDAGKDNPPNSGFISLYSVSGQLILNQPFTVTDTELSVKLDGIAPGEYIVNLVNGDSKIMAKERLIIK